MRRPIHLRLNVVPLNATGMLGPALAAGLLWLAVGLSAGYWVLRAWNSGPVGVLTTLPPPAAHGDVQAVARALGAAASPVLAEPAPAPSSAHWRLLGVVTRPGQAGVALLAFNDETPNPYAVGAAVNSELVLQSVSRQGARLGATLDGPSTVVLQLPDAVDD